MYLYVTQSRDEGRKLSSSLCNQCVSEKEREGNRRIITTLDEGKSLYVRVLEGESDDHQGFPNENFLFFSLPRSKVIHAEDEGKKYT